MTKIAACMLLAVTIWAGFAGPVSAQRVIDAARQSYDNCRAKLAVSPEYLALKGKIGGRMQSDTSFLNERATPEEASQLQTLLQSYLAPCRPFELEVMRIRLPAIVPILEASFTKSDANYQRLITQEITWGQFRQEQAVLGDEVNAAIDRLTNEASRR